MTEIARLPEFWFWENGLSAELCDLAMKDAAWGDLTSANIGVNRFNKEIRNSNVAFAPINHWIEGVLYNAGLYATEQAGWGISVGRPECVQLTKYTQGQHYSKHSDLDFFAPTANIRKISVVALLSDPKDFAGGEFVFSEGPKYVPLVRGSVLAFPSIAEHQVQPVTEGVRYSAVCWINGPR